MKPRCKTPAEVSTALGDNLRGANAGMRVAPEVEGLYVGTATGSPLIKCSAEAHPRSGAVQVNGTNGTLRITALSANDVRLDADGNGGSGLPLCVCQCAGQGNEKFTPVALPPFRSIAGLPSVGYSFGSSGKLSASASTRYRPAASLNAVNA